MINAVGGIVELTPAKTDVFPKKHSGTCWSEHRKRVITGKTIKQIRVQPNCVFCAENCV